MTGLVGLGASFALGSGCSGSSNEGDGGNTDSGSTGNDAGSGTDAGGENDAGVDSGTMDSGTDAGTNDAGEVDAGTVALTVKNYRAWCSVSIDGNAYSAAASQSVNVPAGIVPLAAKPASDKFILGLWHLTIGDTGAGDPGTIDGGISYTTADAGGTSSCVWVCCPFTDGGGCNIADQCP
jgi:hypothetical protein